jgi:hypothetical protein
VHAAESAAFRDGSDPAVGGAPIESLAVVTAQDRPFVAFADGQVDRSSGARD